MSVSGEPGALMWPTLISFWSQLQFPSLLPRAGYRCDRPRLGPPRLALYSLTERARTPFHAEPPHLKTGALQHSYMAIAAVTIVYYLVALTGFVIGGFLLTHAPQPRRAARRACFSCVLKRNGSRGCYRNPIAAIPSYCDISL